MRQGVYFQSGNASALQTIGARPTLSSDGVDITSWSTAGGGGPIAAACLIDGSAGATIASPTGGTAGPEVWAYILAQWYLVGYLNNGVTIPIDGDTQGFATQLSGIGIATRLYVAGTVSAGTATAKYVPMEVA